MLAVADCEEADARVVLSLILEDLCAGAPAPGFEGVETEAENWAALASFDELRADLFAAGKRLARHPLARRGKIRLVQRLLACMVGADRRQAIAESAPDVSGEGTTSKARTAP